MASINLQHVIAATREVEARIGELERLTYAEAKGLPEVAATDTVIAGRKASITVFRRDHVHELEGKTLVVVLAAIPTMFGMSSYHVERGLVFSAHDALRRATDGELQNSGG
jgi:hypothetical protein